MTKVLFVEPRGIAANVFENYVIPLLGAPVLGTMAVQEGYDVTIVNENIGRVTDEELASADVLALSCLTQTVNRGKDIVKRYKSLRQDSGLEAKSVIGGIHASMIPEDVSEHFDHVVVGEGERVFLDILSGDITDKLVRAERAVGYPQGPIPDLRLIKDWDPTGVLPVSTSKGCPNDCSFCCVTGMDGKKYRMLELERVLEEASRYDPKLVFFVDNHFVARKKRTDELLDMMISTGFDRKWAAQTRVQIARKKGLVEKMAKAGCTVVYVGVESANQATLDAMKKRQTVEDIEHAVSVFHDHGISVHGMSILGSDTDDVGESRRLSDFYSRIGIDYAQFSILVPFPEKGKLFDRLSSEGRIYHKDWTLYDAMHVVFEPKHMSAMELQWGMIQCYKEFYSLPKAVEVAGKTLFNSARSALRTVVDSAVDSSERLMFGLNVDPITPTVALINNAKDVYRRMSPAAMRIAGRHILNKWLNANQEYLRKLPGMEKA